MRFTGKIALVIGAGSGLGRQVAISLAAEGATVVVAGRTSTTLTETLTLLRPSAVLVAGGGPASRDEAVVADVSVPAEISALVDGVLARHGRLDVAVNCAGTLGPAGTSLADLSDDDWDHTVATNLTGTYLAMKHEIRAMLPTGGAIVNVASNIGAHGRRPGLGAYAATKAAVSVLTRNTALEYASAGIRINAISPGPLDTPMSLRPGETHTDRATRLATALPAGRVGTLTEAANAILWLASDEAPFTIGTDLVIDGGATA